MADDISETLLTGDEYERAATLTRRVFPVSLRAKIRICLGTLLATVVLFPAVSVRMELIRRLEGSTAGVQPAFVLVAAIGVAVTFVSGLAFVRHLWVVQTRELDSKTAKRLIRTEDFLMAIMVSSGLLFVAAPVLLALLGVAFPEFVASLYEQNIRIYKPDSSVLADPRIVSGAGVVLATTLFVVNVVVPELQRSH
jgi:hypothetical protein